MANDYYGRKVAYKQREDNLRKESVRQRYSNSPDRRVTRQSSKAPV